MIQKKYNLYSAALTHSLLPSLDILIKCQRHFAFELFLKRTFYSIKLSQLLIGMAAVWLEHYSDVVRPTDEDC